MKTFAFISRHKPTPEQIALAAQLDIELLHVGDRDGFTVRPGEFLSFDGVVVVHAAAALRLVADDRPVGVFENGNRAEPGKPPEFYAKALYLYKADGDSPDQTAEYWCAQLASTDTRTEKMSWRLREAVASYPGARPWSLHSDLSGQDLADQLCQEAGCGAYCIDGVWYTLSK